MRLLTWLVCTLGAFATITTPPTSHTVHEKRDGTTDAWTKQSRAQLDFILPIRVALKQQNLDSGDRFLLDISDPDSPNFGKHWTAEKVANTFAPSKESTDITLEWLQVSGINIKRINYSAGRNWLEFSATIAEAERLFDTQYFIYKNKDNGGLRIACDYYGLPQHVREHVDFVMPTIQLDGLRPVGQVGLFKSSPPSYLDLTDLSHCEKMMTINCLRALYGFPAGKYNHTGNQLGIPLWWDSLSAADLKQFHQRFTDPKIPPDTFPEVISIGGEDANDTAAPTSGGSESALDVQTAYSVIWPQQVRLYQVGESATMDSTGSFNVFLDALDASYCTYQGGNQPYMDPSYPSPKDGGYVGPLLCGGAPKSNVLSISYGLVEGGLPRFYQERQCLEWMKLALQGVSVIFASGDNGVANRQNLCLDAEQGHVDAKGTRFAPSFPQSCPYASGFSCLILVTVVGGTTLRNGSISGGEKAVADSVRGISYYSGGGFSDVFARPAWQASAVSKYLSEHAPPYEKSVFNSSGRAYPDVAAIGLNMPIVLNGNDATEGGTSVAAPIFASIITLLNEERLEAGKKPIGFLNPIIYKYPDMFNDITEGKNPGCGTEGFAASTGWDAVTGHGTPRYDKMREVFLKLG